MSIFFFVNGHRMIIHKLFGFLQESRNIYWFFHSVLYLSFVLWLYRYMIFDTYTDIVYMKRVISNIPATFTLSCSVDSEKNIFKLISYWVMN
jgi:hypothetical protein